MVLFAVDAPSPFQPAVQNVWSVTYSSAGGNMIEEVVRKARLQEFSETKQNLAYWLSRTPKERVSAVEYLRRKDLADIEALGED